MFLRHSVCGVDVAVHGFELNEIDVRLGPIPVALVFPDTEQPSSAQHLRRPFQRLASLSTLSTLRPDQPPQVLTDAEHHLAVPLTDLALGGEIVNRPRPLIENRLTSAEVVRPLDQPRRFPDQGHASPKWTTGEARRKVESVSRPTISDTGHRRCCICDGTTAMRLRIVDHKRSDLRGELPKPREIDRGIQMRLGSTPAWATL
ncbi:hypothetical protein D7252_05445 [Microbacterium sp. CGR2]|nr:hypothetical protein D7252_05445 [Microbacterium sp. CGR2]